jgi:hypothetical protein
VSISPGPHHHFEVTNFEFIEILCICNSVCYCVAFLISRLYESKLCALSIPGVCLYEVCICILSSFLWDRGSYLLGQEIHNCMYEVNSVVCTSLHIILHFHRKDSIVQIIGLSHLCLLPPSQIN